MKDHDDKKKGTGAGAVVGAAAGGVAGGAAAGAAVGGITGPVGAALGAAIGAVVGAVSGRMASDPAHDSATADHSGTVGHGLAAEQGSVHTVIGAFDQPSAAQGAVDRLVQAGFDRDDIHVQHQQGHEHGNGAPGFFNHLLDADDPQARSTQQNGYAAHAHTYDEAVRRGSAVVVVDAQGEDRAEQASALLHELGAIDVDERSRQWRAEGWQPPVAAQQDIAAGQGSNARLDDDARLDVVEEQLQVGKRTLDRGGVRVIQRVSSRPVRELVRLREERAVVERRPADRLVTGQDLSNFKEGTLEVHEMVEEPVVAKTARVVEEVRVGKEVREREETIEDTVRRKDVEIERLSPESGRGLERERAVAAGDSLTGSRKAGGGDKPGM